MCIGMLLKLVIKFCYSMVTHRSIIINRTKHSTCMSIIKVFSSLPYSYDNWH